jgi:energy-converting hydrogenase Eha subunit E
MTKQLLCLQQNFKINAVKISLIWLVDEQLIILMIYIAFEEWLLIYQIGSY